MSRFQNQHTQDCGEEPRPTAGDIHFVAMVKGEEKYVFLYDDAGRVETLRTIGRFASNPDLSLTWYDAAMLSQRVRLKARQDDDYRRYREE